jgi:hypothetical protein
MMLTHETASLFARVALGHVAREYPSKLDHVLDDAHDALAPRALHPIFYGSFDWHSCVHGYWLLTHLHRRFPELPEAASIRRVVDAHFTTVNVEAELAYLGRRSSGTFERPYGWAWLLKLAAELAASTSEEGKRWSSTLAPLAEAFAARFFEWLPRATYPIRDGAHRNTAFALALALEWADVRDPALGRAVRDKARAWYENDRDCPAWEPGGDDFLSPALVEVECMRRVLDADTFSAWLDGFLPRLSSKEPKTLFEPAIVSSRSDGKIVHLDGLNLSRAWCFRRLASSLDKAQGDPRREIALEAARSHLAVSLPHVAGDYMGEHWLATYALLALADP